MLYRSAAAPDTLQRSEVSRTRPPHVSVAVRSLYPPTPRHSPPLPLTLSLSLSLSCHLDFDHSGLWDLPPGSQEPRRAEHGIVQRQSLLTRSVLRTTSWDIFQSIIIMYSIFYRKKQINVTFTFDLYIRTDFVPHSLDPTCHLISWSCLRYQFILLVLRWQLLTFRYVVNNYLLVLFICKMEEGL